MITNITLENFKCFRQVSINPKLLTVLIGPNGTGKSSILQALLLLKQSVGEERLQFQGECIDLGDSSAIAPNFSSESVEFSFEITGDISWSDERVSFQYGANFNAPSGTVRASSGNLNTIIRVRNNNRVIDYSLKVDADKYGSTPRIQFRSFSADAKRSKEIATLTEMPSDNDWTGPLLNPNEEFALRLDTRIRAEQILKTPRYALQQIRVVPAVRGMVRPRYPLGDVIADDVSLQAGLSSQEEQTATNLGYSRASEESLSKLLTEVTGIGLRAETVPPQSIEVNAIAPSGQVNIVAEGFGTNSLILLFHQMLNAERGTTVLIEEPEIHLHPKAQAELAEVLAETAKAEDKQIIMTTHSEYVAGRLLTLVAEGTLTTDDLAIYSFDKDEKGECSATEIEVTERGQTKGGLTGFDEATRDEMRRYVDGLRGKA